MRFWPEPRSIITHAICALLSHLLPVGDSVTQNWRIGAFGL